MFVDSAWCWHADSVCAHSDTHSTCRFLQLAVRNTHSCGLMARISEQLQWEDVVLALLVYQQRGFFFFFFFFEGFFFFYYYYQKSHVLSRYTESSQRRRQQGRLADGGTAAARHLLQRPAVCQLAPLSPRDVTVSTPSLTRAHEFSQGSAEVTVHSNITHFLTHFCRSCHLYFFFFFFFLITTNPAVMMSLQLLFLPPPPSCPIILLLCSLSLPLKVIFAL